MSNVFIMSNDHVFFFPLKLLLLALTIIAWPSQCNGDMSMVCKLNFFEATQFLN